MLSEKKIAIQKMSIFCSIIYLKTYHKSNRLQQTFFFSRACVSAFKCEEVIFFYLHLKDWARMN